ncbi:MAG: GTPase HflX [Planctomycetaceae bacterium]
MAEPKREQLKVHAQRAILVAAVDPADKQSREQALEEMTGLAETAGAVIVGTMFQVRDTPDPATYIGKGKVAELKQLAGALDADLLVFDNLLSPAQGKALEQETGVQVVDRSEVILDIFATHARTYESRLQVELAQLLYMRPRLTRMWTHLERIEGGIGSGRGPGEKQLETDRRLIDKRISELQRKLKDVEKRRERQVASRKGHFTVSLVGYTNAGKSTLMSALTGADVYIADKLFATLDTRTRTWRLPHWGDVLLSDTVGFVRNLPHHLVASFKSTLEEARHADLLVHVVDASNTDAQRQIQTVEEVLKEIGIDSHNPLLVLNKVDAVEDRSYVDVLRAKYPHAITVSARRNEGLDKLRTAVADRLSDGYLHVEIETSAGNGRLLSYLEQHAEILSRDYTDNQVKLECRMPRRFLAVIQNDDATITPLNGSAAVWNEVHDPSDQLL